MQVHIQGVKPFSGTIAIGDSQKIVRSDGVFKDDVLVLLWSIIQVAPVILTLKLRRILSVHHTTKEVTGLTILLDLKMFESFC